MHNVMKTMKHILMAICVAGIITPAAAQEDDKNLVSNPGFESADVKRLKRDKKIELAENWYSPTAITADLFSKDAGEDMVKIPKNFRGTEEASDGSNYAGFVAFSYNDKVPRSYVMTKLLFPLKKATKYCVQFKVSLSDISKYSSNNIGAHLSKKALETEDKMSLFEDIHVKHSTNKVFNQQFGWNTICGVYEAEGGEEWLTIGNFASNRDTKYEQMKKPETHKRDKQTYDAYYFIDDVQVFYLDSIEECMCEKEKVEEEAEIVYTKQIITNKELTFAEKVENSAVYFAKNKLELTQSAMKELDLLAEEIKANSEVIELHGHTDPGEAKEAEVNPTLRYLAQRRANAVKKYLEERGVDSNRLTVISHDDQEVADGSDTEIGHAKNRRVELRVAK